MVLKRRTIIEEYYYESEAEMCDHSRTMSFIGYEDSCQVKENVGTIDKPEYKWYGKYFKYENE